MLSHDEAYSDLEHDELLALQDRRVNHSDHLHVEHQDRVARFLLPVPDVVPADWAVAA